MLKVYSKKNCKFCEMLAELLKIRGVCYEIIDVGDCGESLAWLKAQGHRTVPQVYREGEYIGDYSHIRNNIEGVL